MDLKRNWLDKPIHPSLPVLTNEIVLFAVILIAAIATRFYDLETRVMSHDESLHTYFSWLLYRGQGYQHSPMMHGPLQFHLIALSYFMFGVSDFTARIPAVIFGLMSIWMVWYWRRYLGRAGALIAGALMVISPFMLYYTRYVRNDIFAVFSGMLMLYAILRYFECGKTKYLLMIAAALAIHFLAKETAFIYTAQALIFLAIYFIVKITRTPWGNAITDYRAFIIFLSITILLAGLAGGLYLSHRQTDTLTGAETAAPSDPDSQTSPLTPPEAGTSIVTMLLAVAAATSLIATAFFLIRGYTWERLRTERSFELLMVFGTIVLPQLSPLPISMAGKALKISIPTTVPELQALAGDTRGILIIGSFLVLMFALAITAGLLWNPKKWFAVTLIFWIPFTLLYTTIFTNSAGFFTGTIGSLGYWIVQQSVERGSQPWYYYILIQIPMYEYLPFLGLFLALYLGFTRKINSENTETTPETAPAELEEADSASSFDSSVTEEKNFSNMFSLLAYWCVITIVTLTIAGERMPWLTIHMAWPLILITGWALGRLIDTMDWERVKNNNFALTFVSITVFIVSAGRVFFLLNGTIRPFQGQSLDQLEATNQFLLPLFALILSTVAAVYFLRTWTFHDFRRGFVLVFFGLLAVLTVRTSFRAAYITYDQASEFLVYAHGATGIKEVIAQATEISQRTTGGMGVALSYDASAPDTGVSWPFVWYLRDFTNQRSFDQPTRALRDSVVIIVDEKNFDKIEPAIGPGYYRADYIRMWWPMQDYFSLVSERNPDLPFYDDYACQGPLAILKLAKSKDYTSFCEVFTDPGIRAGIFQIWMNRDYTQYALAKGRTDLTLATWQPADKMRLYIRKDVAAQIWNYGVAPTAGTLIEDPTEGKYQLIASNLIFDLTQTNPLALNAPRALAFAPDGSLYVADSRNHRILHLDLEGNILHEWGTYADGANIPIGDGTFNEPWGVAVGPDGSVYVTDTWNHRVEKFTAEGRYLKAWGTFGQGSAPEEFYGPRGLAVDGQGRVYVTDTGNKRIVVFDANGNYITEFGSAGFDPGQFDEPTSVTIDKNGVVYVTDTWNQRIQTFIPIETEEGLSFVPDRQWDIFGWFGQSLENKPFIAVDDNLHVFITDPEGYRVMEFDEKGEIVRVWGEYGNTSSGFGIASGIAVDSEGNVWVTDGAFNRIMRFALP
ncbi:hypothetical protein MASR2M66_33470 [Chloroflexota bacterium]